MPFYSFNGQLIHYQFTDQGMDSTFILIHSLGTDYRIWDKVYNLLLPYGNVLRYDLRGHGLSDYCPAPDGLKDYCSDLTALIDYLGITKNLIPIGLSVGGMIAILLANQFQKRMLKMILADTCYQIGTTSGWNDRIKKVTEGGLMGVSTEIVARWFSENYKFHFPDEIRGTKNLLERCPLQGYIDTCAAIRDADLSQAASAIDIPTLCLAGDEDKATTPEDVKKLADRIKTSSYSIIEESGHLPCLDNPEKMANLIIHFIEDHQ